MRNAVLQDETVTGMPGIGAGQIQPLLDADQRDDAEVRSDVLRALMLDSLVPLTVEARVEDGIVTLTGTVSWHGERDDARFLVACVPGVLGILDEITLIPAHGGDGGDLQDDIAEALGRSAAVDDGELWVEGGCDGTVVLSGQVHSWAEHDEAVAAAWSVPGVTGIDDRVLVNR
jgi:osmotically-inducible protein OsmY